MPAGKIVLLKQYRTQEAGIFWSVTNFLRWCTHMEEDHGYDSGKFVVQVTTAQYNYRYRRINVISEFTETEVRVQEII